MAKKTINDLPPKLVGEKILAKVPITSLLSVRSTCKLWERLSKNWIVGKEAARQHQFLGFIIVDDKVCSLRFHLRRKGGEEEEDSVGVVDLSIKQVNLLNQIEIKRRVFHCDGLLLCVPLDKSKLVAWNPYLGQTRSISPRTDFHFADSYLFGYDLNRNYKILRYLDRGNVLVSEIYDFSSNSWKVLEFRPDWVVEDGALGVSLKGNTYFLAQDAIDNENDILLCFDFTTERFGQRLLLPFYPITERTLTLSSVRDEKLALLHQKAQEGKGIIEALEIWITTKIEPNAVAWSKFMKVDMRPLIGDRLVWFHDWYGTFFIDEEEKVVVVFDMDGYEFCCELTKTAHYHTAFIIGDDGYYRTVLLGEAPNMWKPPSPGYSGYVPQIYAPPLVCSSVYLPSLMQLGQLRKRKQRHGK